MKRVVLLLLISAGILHADINKLRVETYNGEFVEVQYDNWTDSTEVRVPDGMIFNDEIESNSKIMRIVESYPVGTKLVAVIRFDFHIIELYGSYYSISLTSARTTQLAYIGENVPKGLLW